MQKVIIPSTINGELNAPPSKSLTQRAIASALLAKGKTVIFNPSFCNDSVAALAIVESLGAKVERFVDKIEIIGGRDVLNQTLNCGESGLAVRMFSPIAALYNKEFIVSGEGSLQTRPLNMIEDALVQLGASVKTNNGFLPLSINGLLKGGKAFIDGSLSSQLLTGLLMALPCAENDSLVYMNQLRSKPYIDMTIQLLDKFNIEIKNNNYESFEIKGKQKYKAIEYTVEGDWSGASFLLVAGAIGGSITVDGLSTFSRQSDVRVLSALRDSGAKISVANNKITVEKAELRCFNFDATECPDLFPPLVALAAYCEGVSEISGVERLLHKESNRAIALKQEFEKLGIEISFFDNKMFVKGGNIHSATIDSHNDHRIAMAAVVAAIGAKGKTVINSAECIAKSYPDFFVDMKKVGVEIM
ncbi:MAG: 3-phosphoshikimate 1-carboxyvinyltransferase [Bacteroidota bacterium]